MAEKTDNDIVEIDSVETLDVVLSDLVTALGAELMHEHNRNPVDNRKRILIEGDGAHRMARLVEFEEAFDGEHTTTPVLKPRDFLDNYGNLKEEMEIPATDSEGHLGFAKVVVRPQ